MCGAVDPVAGTAQGQSVILTSAIGLTNDVLLAHAAREGDRPAFGKLYDRFARMVHGILLARVPRSEVDDLVQDVFLQALRRVHTLRDPSAFGPWLAMIARNRAMDFHRRNRETSELSDEIAARDPQQAEAVAVFSAIKDLPEAYRETLMLRLVEGMTGQEIADRTGLTAASVRVNLHRGMKLLREKLGGE